MGWTSTSCYERFDKGMGVRRYLDREYEQPADAYRFEILDSALVALSEYYALCRSTEIATGEAVEFAIVTMVKYNRKAWDGHTLAWKSLEESMGPCLYRCPVRILDRLPPTENENALEWRRRCRAHHAAQARAKALLKEGAEVVIEPPLTFRSGRTYGRFTVQHLGRRLRFRAPDGALCAIPQSYHGSLRAVS